MAVKRRMPSKTKLSSTLALLRARLVTEEEGATAIEYALMASGIGTAVRSAPYDLVAGSALMTSAGSTA